MYIHKIIFRYLFFLNSLGLMFRNSRKFVKSVKNSIINIIVPFKIKKKKNDIFSPETNIIIRAL